MKFKPVFVAIPFERIKMNVKKLDPDKFWDNAEKVSSGISDARGCYIFGLQAAGGIKPYYVGKTSGQSFKNEVFTPDKMLKYREAMDKRKNGTPVLVLIQAITQTGKIAKGDTGLIDWVESRLIESALARNPNDLINKLKTNYPSDVVIPGFWNSPVGANKHSKALNAMLFGAKK